MLYSIAILSIGASCGAILRWFISLQFNTLFQQIPLGTLIANLLGGYLIGLMIGLLSEYPLISHEIRLLIITGFLGALTTFSTFSAEVVTLLQEERFAWALGCIGLHVTGSILLTLLGIMTISYLHS